MHGASAQSGTVAGRVRAVPQIGGRMARAYYNENDPYAAQWLRNLIAAGHIAPGDVDERSIVDVRASDLTASRRSLRQRLPRYRNR